MSSRVLSREDQMPLPGSTEEKVLKQIYAAFDNNKHAFEWLASRVAEQVLGESGARYQEGLLTKAGGDGGMDFVGRLDVYRRRQLKFQDPACSARSSEMCRADLVNQPRPSSSGGRPIATRLDRRLRHHWLLQQPGPG